MATPNPQKIVRAFHRSKTAGEVRFIKDKGSDHNEWGWGTPGPSEREISENFEFRPSAIKPLAQVLRSLLMALGHATSAHSRFVKVKSRSVSPDGSLGGKGYIQKIPEMRRQIMNSIEVLSSTSDTLHDELNAPHWQPGPETGNRERAEVEEILDDASDIKDDPEGWAEEQEEEMDDENEAETTGKTASLRTIKSLEDSLDKLSSRANELDQLLKMGPKAHAAAGDPGLLKLQEGAEALRILASKVSRGASAVLPRVSSPSAKRVASRYQETRNV
jgi:hypothetical protein